MRQKFKVWDKKNLLFDDSNDIYVDMDGGIYLIEERNWAMSSYMQREEVSDRYELVWYTGLEDKNGVEVYDRDVFECTSELLTNFGTKRTGIMSTTIYEVIWRKEGWGKKVLRSECLVVGTESDGLEITLGYAEVIGSIYTHPHLLGSEKD